jgi:hypothetical protein
MDFSTFGKWIVWLGLGLAAVGVIIWLAVKIGVPFGSLPGDFRVDRRFSFHFPLATSIIIILLLPMLNILLWFVWR